LVVDIINDNVINRKEILLLTIGPKEWKSLEPIYRKYTKNQDYDVYIVPIPIFFKDIYGRVNALEKDILNAIDYNGYPEELELSLWTSYSPELHRPDVIYVQNPYDSVNPCLTVPAQFYSENIRFYTDKLVYVPPFVTGEFSSNDYNDIYNMKHYVTAPGVLYADEVIVQSNNIKMHYVDKLSEFAGEDTKSLWEDRIKTSCEADYDLSNDESSITSCDRQNGNIRKKILYCIGLNEISEHTSDILDKIKARINTFNEAAEDIEVGVMFFPLSEDEWYEVDGEIAGNIKNLIDNYADAGWRYISSCDKMDCYDAYYGSASPYALMFSQKKKPVMIADYNI